MQNSVLVMTVQILENKLRDESIRFNEFQMLVLDEGHHARGDSPYSKVLWLYRCQPDAMQSSIKVRINQIVVSYASQFVVTEEGLLCRLLASVLL